MNAPLPEMNFHHVGLLVTSIQEALPHYSALFGPENISPVFFISSQNVNVCFVGIAPGRFIELVEPAAGTSAVSGMLNKRIGYYHLAYEVNDLRAMVDRLENLNYKALDYFRSEAFPGKECIFLYTPEAHLIELIG